jgi:hypothetical protein
VTVALKAACEDVMRRLGLDVPGPPNVTAVERAAAAIDGAGNGLQQPARVEDWDAIALRLGDKVENGVPLTTGELCKAAWCLWTTRPALGNSPTLLEALLRQVAAAERRRPFRALASSFVAAFDPARPGINVTGRVLAVEALRWGKPWQGLQEVHSFFHPEEGPRRLARTAIESGGTVPETLRQHGLGTMAAGGGYAKAVTGAILRELAGGAEVDHRRRLERIRQVALRPEGSLIFEDQSVLVAEALLRPFRRDDPDIAIQDLFLQTVLSLFGDPRLRPGRWNQLRELEDIVQRWLTRQSLRQFLEIVDQTADLSMWKYRRRFWEAVHNAGLVKGAWVVLGPDGVSRARRAFGKSASFAQFSGGGRKQVASGHAVLLLQVGRGVVADWSHNGKCNIWADADMVGAPKLFRGTYDSDEVRIAAGTGNLETDSLFSIMHMSSETYNWQNKVADRLFKMTGFRLQQTLYRVR